MDGERWQNAVTADIADVAGNGTVESAGNCPGNTRWVSAAAACRPTTASRFQCWSDQGRIGGVGDVGSVGDAGIPSPLVLPIVQNLNSFHCDQASL